MTQVTSTEVDLDSDEFSPRDEEDAFTSIRSLEDEVRQASIETMNEEGDAETPESTETSKSAPATSRETGRVEATKRPGIDEVLRNVENQLGDADAEVVRGILSGYHKTQAEWKQAQAEVNESLQELEDLKAAYNQQPQEADPDLARVTPQQWETFQKMLRQQGVPLRAELEQEQALEDHRDAVDSDIDKGLEEFGEEFGHRNEDGQFVFSSDIRDDCEREFQRLYDPEGGPTARDLFRLVKFDQLIEEAEERGAGKASASARTNDRRRAKDAVRSVVESRSASGVRTRDSIYKPGTNQNFEDVVARASLAALREMPSVPSD
tara:strand:- start:3402 stop:4367 length:966 start_codon:yes stop_codon:yes gene_type:complete